MFLRSFIYFVWDIFLWFLSHSLALGWSEYQMRILFNSCQVIASELLFFGSIWKLHRSQFSCGYSQCLFVVVRVRNSFALKKVYYSIKWILQNHSISMIFDGATQHTKTNRQTETKSNEIEFRGFNICAWYISPFHSYFNLNRISISIWKHNGWLRI